MAVSAAHGAEVTAGDQADTAGDTAGNTRLCAERAHGARQQLQPRRVEQRHDCHQLFLRNELHLLVAQRAPVGSARPRRAAGAGPRRGGKPWRHPHFALARQLDAQKTATRVFGA